MNKAAGKVSQHTGGTDGVMVGTARRSSKTTFVVSVPAAGGSAAKRLWWAGGWWCCPMRVSRNCTAAAASKGARARALSRIVRARLDRCAKSGGRDDGWMGRRCAGGDNLWRTGGLGCAEWRPVPYRLGHARLRLRTVEIRRRVPDRVAPRGGEGNGPGLMVGRDGA